MGLRVISEMKSGFSGDAKVFFRITADFTLSGSEFHRVGVAK